MLLSYMKRVIVIGGGIAGMEAAANLRDYEVTIIEKDGKLGGNVANWDRLFPIGEKAEKVLKRVSAKLDKGIDYILDVKVIGCDRVGEVFNVKLSNGTTLTSDAVVVATGFEPFDAHRKEEYGYGIYSNVITSVDLEQMFTKGKVVREDGKEPKRVAFIHCVGSRDDKVCNNYCSKACCVTAVKQASEFKEMYPEADVYCFYMDLRMFDKHFEELYKKAQMEYNVKFIRGRLSEAAEDFNGNIVIKAEDTLIGKPVKITMDMVVLMVGMEARRGNATMLNTPIGDDHFYETTDEYVNINNSNISGLFYAGCCTCPKTIPETLADARSAAIAVDNYLKA